MSGNYADRVGGSNYFGIFNSNYSNKATVGREIRVADIG